MEITGAEAEFVGETAQRWLGKTGRADLPVGPDLPQRVLAFTSLPVAVQRRVLQQQLIKLGVPTDFDLVERLRQAVDVPMGVGPGFFVLRDAAGRVDLRTKPSAAFNAREAGLRLAGRGGSALFDGVRLDWRFQTGADFVRPRRQTAREFFDADRVGGRITLRHWRPGDRFQPIGLKSPVKLQDLFTNLKIPRARRGALVVAAAAGGEIFWIEGVRISENFKLTPQTKRCLVWRWRHPAGRVRPV
jgi:tRNA(Ile)-lysidine synthetase-like protein